VIKTVDTNFSFSDKMIIDSHPGQPLNYRASGNQPSPDFYATQTGGVVNDKKQRFARSGSVYADKLSVFLAFFLLRRCLVGAHVRAAG
jgi:hypothetical protein